MPYRYFIRFSYDGTNYHGWQIQPNGMTVQEMMTNIMRRIFGPGLELTGAGRTDSGVHAEMMYAHFDVDKYIDDTHAMACKLNYMMPADISVQEVRQVRPDAHARFDAVSRRYEYRICQSKTPFQRNFVTHISSKLDVEAMNKASEILFEYSDFTSFSKLHTDVKTNNCKITKAYWENIDGLLVFTIEADRFLRNMVRAIVGTMLDVGRGKIDLGAFRNIIELKDRCEAGTSVEARGLFLVDVSYPEELFI
jgi:tRNA pseudouridine38-40 synthase